MDESGFLGFVSISLFSASAHRKQVCPILFPTTSPVIRSVFGCKDKRRKKEKKGKRRKSIRDLGGQFNQKHQEWKHLLLRARTQRNHPWPQQEPSRARGRPRPTRPLFSRPQQRPSSLAFSRRCATMSTRHVPMCPSLPVALSRVSATVWLLMPAASL